MEFKSLTPNLSVCGQIAVTDLAAIARAGFKSVICNRPDGEGADQPRFAEIEAAALGAGLQIRHLPVESGKVSDTDATAFGELLHQLPQPVLAWCRTGMRSASLWALSRSGSIAMSELIEVAAKAGYDLQSLAQRGIKNPNLATEVPAVSHDILIVGGGSAGIAVAASLLVRSPDLDIAIVEPADTHHYQPGWTMVGAGVFDVAATARPMASVLPRQVHWIKARVTTFEPQRNAIVLEDGRTVKYQQLVVCPGLSLDWAAIDGLTDTLGRNGVTSNYRVDLAPYTWQLVQQLRGGKAIFTQPPMPVKCAGAPQKAMYLSADYWKRRGVLKNVDIQFFNAGAVLFGVADYVPALMEYIKAYGINLNFGHTLLAVDGSRKTATFGCTRADGTREVVTREFDMIHVVPPQKAPDFVRTSALANDAGWVDVDPGTLRHKTCENVFSLGDVTNTTNAKTAAAARKQAPVVAHNLLALRGQTRGLAHYDGYGSCPLTVERGKIVLAEFTYGGKLAPSFPKWLIDGTNPSRLAWQLKEHLLPFLYWHAMLKGREWLAKPDIGA